MTGKVFTKLFFSFVVVLFVGMAVLDFSLRQVLNQSLRAQAEDSLIGEARLLAADISVTGVPDAGFLQRIARLDAPAAGVEVSLFDDQGRQVASSQDTVPAAGQTSWCSATP